MLFRSSWMVLTSLQAHSVERPGIAVVAVAVAAAVVQQLVGAEEVVSRHSCAVVRCPAEMAVACLGRSPATAPIGKGGKD